MNKNIYYSFVFASLISFGAWVSLPIGPVPLTLQTVFVFMAGLLLSMPYAVTAVIIYLTAGAIGIPVFANGNSGLNVFTGPTGGFLIGFVIAVMAVSYLSRHNKFNISNKGWRIIYWNALLPCIIGTIVIQGCGMIWGKIYMGNDWGNIYDVWLEPFYFNMIIKIIIASLVAVEIWKYQNQKKALKISAFFRNI
jgi:biotin transport system substrate-specific component